MSTAQTDAAASARRIPTWLTVTVSGVFGLFYAYAVWNAVAFLISQASGPLGLNGYGWFVLLMPVVLPLIVFGAAFAVGYRRSALHLLLTLLTGLALVSVFWLNIVGYAASSGASLLG